MVLVDALIIKPSSPAAPSLDEIISAAISKDREFRRLEILLKSILRAGTLELLREHNVPLAVIIDEYVEIAHAFYFENEDIVLLDCIDWSEELPYIDNLTVNIRKNEFNIWLP